MTFSEILHNIFKAMPHKDCAHNAPPDFSADCIKISQIYCRMSRDFCVICRKICKQDACKAIRRALCGVALMYIKILPAKKGALLIYIICFALLFFSKKKQMQNIAIAAGSTLIDAPKPRRSTIFPKNALKAISKTVEIPVINPVAIPA